MPHTSSDPRLFHEIHGTSGPPVLLIMGFGMRGVVWRTQIDDLKADHQCCTYDHPGLGQSDEGERWPTIPHLAGHAARLLDELGWRSAHVVGVSMGGMVAQELALAAPARVRSLALIATHAGGLLSALPAPEGVRLFIEANTRDAAGRLEALQSLLYTPDFLRGVDTAKLSLRMRDQVGVRAPRRTVLGQLHAVVRHRTARRLGAIRAPTLVIRPGRDILIRPLHSDRIHASIPGATLCRIDDAGHGCTFQAADRVNAALRAHIHAAEAAGAGDRQAARADSAQRMVS